MTAGCARDGLPPRIVDALLGEILADHPAVLIVGPRASGKTTTAGRHTAGRLRLDRPAEAAVARADPDAAIADGPFPLLIDEWQLAPDILGAVKRAVDETSWPWPSELSHQRTPAGLVD